MVHNNSATGRDRAASAIGSRRKDSNRCGRVGKRNFEVVGATLKP